MTQKRLMSVDTDTGEVLDYALVAVPQKLHNAFVRWAAMSLEAFEQMAKDLTRLEDYRVRDALLARLDFENLIQIQQVEIAKALGMDKAAVSRSIKRLTELKILLEGPKIGRSRTYRLNPSYGWRGSAKGHHKALRSHDRAMAAGLKVHKGGKSDDDVAMRAKMEAEGQSRLFD